MEQEDADKQVFDDGDPGEEHDPGDSASSLQEEYPTVTAISLCPEYIPLPIHLGQSITAGRSKESSFRLLDCKVSLHHFTIRHNFLAPSPPNGHGLSCAGCFLEDHSRNGTWLRRGTRRWLLRGTRAALHDGDVVSVLRPYTCPSHGDACLGTHPTDPDGCALRFGDRRECGALAVRFEIRGPAAAAAAGSPLYAEDAAARRPRAEKSSPAVVEAEGSPECSGKAGEPATEPPPEHGLSSEAPAAADPPRAVRRAAADAPSASACIGDLREWEGLCRTAERVAAAAARRTRGPAPRARLSAHRPGPSSTFADAPCVRPAARAHSRALTHAHQPARARVCDGPRCSRSWHEKNRLPRILAPAARRLHTRFRR